jgi:cyclic pyranopterin monophosphate synthase
VTARKKAVKRELSHLDARGNARMIDVSEKTTTTRTATARGTVRMQPSTLRLLLSGETPKGDVLAVARIAGIQAAKQTSLLIPMCHQVQITGVQIEIAPSSDTELSIAATVRAADRTGVEMEALTAVSVAALTIYDMLKAVDRAIIIGELALYEKTGGKSGDFKRTSQPDAFAARKARSVRRRP